MFCLRYHPSIKNFLSDIDQIKIQYNPADSTLVDFLEFYKTKTILINVTCNLQNIHLNLFQKLYDKFKNFKLIINFNKHRDIIQEIENRNIPFFFSNFITSIDMLHGYAKYGPTDMYICQDLGFALDKVYKILNGKNIRVRVFPNICQSSFSETESIKTFFIRPEDIDLYSNYVDVFEIVTAEDDYSRQITLYNIYKDRHWYGKMNEIIYSFNSPLDNKYLIKNFGLIRIGCGKRCMYKPGVCNICDRFIGVS